MIPPEDSSACSAVSLGPTYGGLQQDLQESLKRLLDEWLSGFTKKLDQLSLDVKSPGVETSSDCPMDPVWKFRVALVPHDASIVRALDRHSFTRRFQAAGDGWNEVVAHKLSGNVLTFQLRTKDAHERVGQSLGQLREVLHLTSDGRVLEEEALVEITDFDTAFLEALAKDRVQREALIEEWNKDNNISLKGFFWTWRKLIWQLDSAEDARRLCTGHVFICSRAGHAR